MKIESIILTPEEMLEAMAVYLNHRGLHVKVESVDSRGYPIKEWELCCQPKEDVAPSITSVEALGKAIEAGTV